MTAYLDGTLVGSEGFDTGGGGLGGWFAGVEFESPFDLLVMDAGDGVPAAFCIDDLRFDAPATTEGPETAADALDGLLTLIVELRDQGILNRGQANALTRQLEVARRLIGRGNVRPALNVLDAFMDHTRALAAGGMLDPATVGELNTLAESARDLVTA